MQVIDFLRIIKKTIISCNDSSYILFVPISSNSSKQIGVEVTPFLNSYNSILIDDELK